MGECEHSIEFMEHPDDADSPVFCVTCRVALSAHDIFYMVRKYFFGGGQPAVPRDASGGYNHPPAHDISPDTLPPPPPEPGTPSPTDRERWRADILTTVMFSSPRDALREAAESTADEIIAYATREES